MRDFSLKAYRHLLLTFYDADYTFCMFDEIDEQLGRGKHALIVLRHDIDISMRAASEIAQMEHALGIRTAYFVALNSPFYNLFSASSAAILAQIHAWGHQIGLHVDLRIHKDAGLGVQAEIEMALRMYPFINPHIASLHSPIALHQDLIEASPPLERVYGHFLRQKMAYISESTGRWRYGYPLDTAAFSAREPLQLLTHPIWWVQEAASPVAKLESQMYADYLVTCATAKEYLPKLFTMQEASS